MWKYGLRWGCRIKCLLNMNSLSKNAIIDYTRKCIGKNYLLSLCYIAFFKLSDILTGG